MKPSIHLKTCRNNKKVSIIKQAEDGQYLYAIIVLAKHKTSQLIKIYCPYRLRHIPRWIWGTVPGGKDGNICWRALEVTTG